MRGLTALARDRAHRYIQEMDEPPDEPAGAPTPRDEFLYHLTELEKAVERSIIEWDVVAALAAQRRLDRLAAIVRRIAAEIRSH